MKKKGALRIGLFLTRAKRDYNKCPASTWIRIWQMMDVYRQQGAEVHFNNYLKRYDVAILYRKSKFKYFMMLLYLKRISKTVFFDTCINLFEINEEISTGKLKYSYEIARKADGIICASKQIAAFSGPHTKTVFTLEDPINLEHFSKIKKNINFQQPKFGWSGVACKVSPLNKYADRISGRILIISEKTVRDVDLNFAYDFTRWQYETFPEKLLKCDIALLPRDVNSSYNQGHSSFKALVFAVLGIPIIASKVPSYIDMARYYDGIVFLEDHGDDIDRCIAELKCRDLGTTRVRHYYSRDMQARMLLAFLEKQLSP